MSLGCALICRGVSTGTNAQTNTSRAQPGSKAFPSRHESENPLDPQFKRSALPSDLDSPRVKHMVSPTVGSASSTSGLSARPEPTRKREPRPKLRLWLGVRHSLRVWIVRRSGRADVEPENHQRSREPPVKQKLREPSLKRLTNQPLGLGSNKWGSFLILRAGRGSGHGNAAPRKVTRFGAKTLQWGSKSQSWKDKGF